MLVGIKCVNFICGTKVYKFLQRSEEVTLRFSLYDSFLAVLFQNRDVSLIFISRFNNIKLKLYYFVKYVE